MTNAQTIADLEMTVEAAREAVEACDGGTPLFVVNELKEDYREAVKALATAVRAHRDALYAKIATR